MNVADVILNVLSRRGVIEALLLDQKQLGKVRNLEEDYSRRLTPWGYPVNLGVFECLKRRYVSAVLTTSGFKWPSGPYALLKIGDYVVGTIDENGVRIRRVSLLKPGEKHMVVFLPLNIPELEDVTVDPVVASPSPPTHSYLIWLFSLKCSECGTLLVGFNGVKAL
ncbi:MAG: hypothetical protein NZ954_00790 [Thermofilaceae archaeon]|nr:hypothetical protein [Thermofilaceae archaeon]MDW8003998.1 hypothetical protein [Thermofilaceae archaeon]